MSSSDLPRQSAAPAPRMTTDRLVPGGFMRCHIDTMDEAGNGCGRGPRGADLVVRGAYPGEYVEVRIERVFAAKKRGLCGVLEVLEPSPARVQPPTLYPSWALGSGAEDVAAVSPLLDASMSLALDVKRARVQAELDAAGVVLPAPLGDVVTRCDVLRGADMWGARQRIKGVFGTRQTADGPRVFLGHYIPATHRLVDTARDPAPRPALRKARRALLSALTAVLDDVPVATDTASGLKAASLRDSKGGVAASLQWQAAENEAALPPALTEVLSRLVETGALRGVRVRVHGGGNNQLAGTTAWTAGEATLAPLEGGPDVDMDAFCQPDPALAAWLYTYIGAWLAADAPADAAYVDAYAGAGGFARGVREAGAEPGQITAIERAAWCQAPLASLGVQVRAEDAGKALADLAHAGAAVHGMVLDPAKKGIGAAAAHVCEIAPTRLALVSCGPAAYAKDLRALTAGGYRVTGTFLLDFFPGTADVESIALLERV